MGNLVLTADHRYLLDGVEIPGVTRILEAAGLSDVSRIPADVLKRASDFGHAVHAVVNFKYKGTLDEASVDDEVKPYVQGWDNFVEDFEYRCKVTEYRFCNLKYRFAGTIDQCGTIDKGKYEGDVLLDIKTGMAYPSHKYQLAGYTVGITGRHNTAILYLNPAFNRGYKVIFASNNKREQGVFLSALTLYNVRKSEGLL